MKKTAAKKTAAKKKVKKVEGVVESDITIPLKVVISKADELEKQINSIKNILDLEWNGSMTCVQAIERISEIAVFGRKIIKINSERWYRCIHCPEGYILQYKWWQDDEWCDVCDLSELKIWEYNQLVSELEKYYPEYPIEYLEGRFV